ncbi:hypothetical protein UFOVP124_44 [uncultured Caudovirales phage]|uniref:Uncharacterized protein n=1 Tax=uncultured Caudovirales phage TaxID=2100421 RepID=A0A6J5LBV0_9CAUD|nr:hypothetical protein UFOVP124_44 [uncultured Caudovirales phage]
MAASNRFINISGCVFTKKPSGTVSINTVQSVALGKRGKEVQASGDADFFPTLSVTVGAAPQVTVQHQNQALLNTLDEKITGSSFVFVSNDAVNGTGSGAITYTLSNCHVVSHEKSSQHQAVGSCTLTISAYSSDGTTSPLALSIAV